MKLRKIVTELREQTKHPKWLIVSGGDQDELREVLVKRDLAKLFDGGIFGSPDTKDTILDREQENGNIAKTALFLGDSKYDYQASHTAGLDFIFISKWTEVVEWEKFCSINKLKIVYSLINLI